MATNFPTSLDTSGTLPAEGATTLLSVNHVTAHQNIQDALEAIEAKVGADSSAVTTSHDYKLGEVTGSDKAVGKTATQTLTNKTLTSPSISGATLSGNTLAGVIRASGSGGIEIENNSGTDVLILGASGSTGATFAGQVNVGTNLQITNGNSIVDGNSNEVIKVVQTASAVNEISVKNAATGNAVEIQATGGDTNVSTKFVPKGTGAFFGTLETICIPIGDETTTITTGTAKVTFRMPYAFKVTKVKASLTTVSSSGAPQFDINESGSSILSTKLTIDASEKTSATAATAAVISDDTLADDAEMTIDVDTAGTGAAGAKIYIIGYATATPA